MFVVDVYILLVTFYIVHRLQGWTNWFGLAEVQKGQTDSAAIKILLCVMQSKTWQLEVRKLYITDIT